MKYLTIILLCLLVAISSCRNDLSEVETTSRIYEPTKETGRNIDIIYTENGDRKARLTAPKLVRSKTKDPFVEFPEGLIVRFYNDTLQITSSLRANYGIRYEKENKTYFRDSVELKNVDNEQLYTEELIWDEENEKIFSEKFVRIVTPEERITGKGFEADQQFSNYTIKNITGQIYVQPD